MVDQFATLIHPGVSVPPVVTSLAGISNDMLRSAPRSSVATPQLARFIGQILEHAVQYILLCFLDQEKKFCADPAKTLTGRPRP